MVNINYSLMYVTDDRIVDDQQTKVFMNNCKKFGYDENKIKDIVEKEVPYIVRKKDIEKIYENIEIDIFTLWSDKPQLYIITQMSRRSTE